GDRLVVVSCVGRVFVMDEVDDADLVVERVAALDLGKAGLEACVRVPHPQRPGRRMQELRGYATTTAQLLAMAGWLRHWHVQRVVMESTSTYWKGVYYLLEAEGFDCWLVNAREVKNVPGRAGAAPRDPPTARSHPLPARPGARPHPRAAAGGKAARGCPDQDLGGAVEPARRHRSGDHGRPNRRGARSAHAGRAGQGQRTQEDRPARRGAARVLHRSPRDDPADDARQQRPHQRPDRRTRRPYRGGDWPFLPTGGPAR